MFVEGVIAGGRYRLVRPIGEGGTSDVWCARDELGDREVALAISPRPADPERVARFFREAEIIGHFQHRNIASVLEAGELVDGGCLFVVTELLRGSPLSARREPGVPMTEEDALEIVIPVCWALEVAHDAGVVHRDLTPASIYLAEDEGRGVVPKLVGPRAERSPGTLAYASPEQARGRAGLGPASDLWSIGVILHEMLSGERPFSGASPAALLHSICEGEPAPLPASVDPLVQAIVARCLRKDPARRYPDAASLRTDLERARAELSMDRTLPPMVRDFLPLVPITQLSEPARGAGSRPRWRSPVVMALLAAALCAAAVAAVPRQRTAAARAEPAIGRVARAVAARVR